MDYVCQVFRLLLFSSSIPCSGQYHVEPVTAKTGYGLDPVYKDIAISTFEDDILEREECLCLQLSPTQNSNVFFTDNRQARLCFEDNEGEPLTLAYTHY